MTENTRSDNLTKALGREPMNLAMAIIIIVGVAVAGLAILVHHMNSKMRDLQDTYGGFHYANRYNTGAKQ